MSSVPRLRQRSADIRDALSPRELRWMRRNAFQAARRDPVAAALAGIGCMVLVLMPFTAEISQFLKMSQAGIAWCGLVVGLGFCLAGLARWRSRYVWAVPGLLLQINRCGCCGAGFAKRDASWASNSRCPECGVGWSPLARLAPMETALDREAA
ncbi:MAG: hypothetical protein MK085_10475 [Phycisphaerales bacterium]|nr:hypothetical protein [Phycisphaerales bacterium]